MTDFLFPALLVYFSAGLILLVTNVIRYPEGFKDRPLVLWLLLVPSIGWGLWAYKHQPRPGGIELVPKSSMVLSRMGTLHAILLGIGFMAIISTLMGLWQVHDPFGPDSIANQSGNASAAGFDMVLSGAEVGLGLLAFMFILLGFAFWLVIFSVLPWIIGGSIRRQYQRQLLLRAHTGSASWPNVPDKPVRQPMGGGPTTPRSQPNR